MTNTCFPLYSTVRLIPGGYPAVKQVLGYPLKLVATYSREPGYFPSVVEGIRLRRNTAIDSIRTGRPHASNIMIGAHLHQSGFDVRALRLPFVTAAVRPLPSGR